MKISRPLILIAVILVVAGTLGGIYLANKKSAVTETPQEDNSTARPDDAPNNGSSEQKLEFKGSVLAGNSSKIYDFNQADLETAKQTDLLIVLYFYANWCPICREELPHLYGAFNDLSTDRVVGFRVNFNDSDTDDSERAVAREHGITYQHSKVFIKNGQRVLKSPESWRKQRYITEISNHLN